MREVNPGVKGLMMGFDMSPDDRFAAAYTNYNQTILLNSITSDFIVIDNPLDEGQTIQGLLVHDNSLVIYGQYSWAVFSTNGKLLETRKIATDTSFPILSMIITFKKSISALSTQTGISRFPNRIRKSLTWKSPTKEKRDELRAMSYLIIRWSGTLENDELRLESTDEDNLATTLECHGGIVLNSKKTKVWTCPEMESNNVTMIDISDKNGIKETEYCENSFKLLELRLSTDESYLIGTFTEGFQLWKTTDNEGSEVTTLKLPRSVRNVSVKMNKSNQCILSKGNIWAIAGVRKVMLTPI